MRAPWSVRHLALVYREDDQLTQHVSDWTDEALRAGGGAILLGSVRHLEGIRAHLTRVRGVDVDTAERSGRYLAIEADWLMARFLLDGTPDEGRFRELVGDMFARVESAVGQRPIHAWGEMVSLLRARNNARAAHCLEELWCAEIARRPFRLLCSYPSEHEPGLPENGDLRRAILSTHDHVVDEGEPEIAAASQGIATAPLGIRAPGPGSGA